MAKAAYVPSLSRQDTTLFISPYGGTNPFISAAWQCEQRAPTIFNLAGLHATSRLFFREQYNLMNPEAPLIYQKNKSLAQ